VHVLVEENVWFKMHVSCFSTRTLARAFIAAVGCVFGDLLVVLSNTLIKVVSGKIHRVSIGSTRVGDTIQHHTAPNGHSLLTSILSFF